MQLRPNKFWLVFKEFSGKIPNQNIILLIFKTIISELWYYNQIFSSLWVEDFLK